MGARWAKICIIAALSTETTYKVTTGSTAVSRQTLHSYMAVGTAGESSVLLVAMFVLEKELDEGKRYDRYNFIGAQYSRT